MTRGRRREHFQWNMDIIGVPGVEVSVYLYPVHIIGRFCWFACKEDSVCKKSSKFDQERQKIDCLMCK